MLEIKHCDIISALCEAFELTNQLIRIQNAANRKICIYNWPAVLTASEGQQFYIFHRPAQRKYVSTASGNRDFISSPVHVHIRLANDLNSKITYVLLHIGPCIE